METSRIFLNYRRVQESGWAADAIRTRLLQEFGQQRVFLDVDNILPGTDYMQEIRAAMRQAAALVVVMGRDWHKIQDEDTGNKRIDEPDDWVREEIRTALQRDIPIFILLLEDAELPKPEWNTQDIRRFLNFQRNRIHQASADNDLKPVLEGLARETEIQPVRVGPSGSYDTPARMTRSRLSPHPPNLANSRAPIVIAIEEAASRITGQELLGAERHLTVTLSAEQANVLRSVQARFDDCRSVEATVALGMEAWFALSSASDRLQHLLELVAVSEDKEGFPQPIAWTGHLDLLTAIHRAILIASVGKRDAVMPFLTVSNGAHYFHSLTQQGHPPRSMQPRLSNGKSKVRIGHLEPTSAGEAALRMVDAALENEVVLVTADDIDDVFQQMVRLLPGQSTSPIRVVVGFGNRACHAASIAAMLEVVRC